MLSKFIAFGLSFSICYGTSVGLGLHESDIPRQWEAPVKKTEYVFSVLYNPALMATKTSILLFYLTLAKTQRLFKWLTIATLAVVNVGGLALTLVNTFQCRPIGAAFETPIPASASCEDIVTLYLSSAPLNIITDLAIFFLPMPILTAMRLPRKQKIILIITFGFGFFVAVVDVVRIAYLQEASSTYLSDIQSNGSSSGTALRNTQDISWYASLSFMWSAVEVNVGIMCACVPGLKPLVSRYMPNILRDVARGPSFSRGTDRVDSLDVAAKLAPQAPPPSMTKPEVAASSDSIADRSNNEEAVDMLDFLTTPDMHELPQNIKRQQTAQTHTTRRSHVDAKPTYFDFVNMNNKKSMVQMTGREAVFPVAMVTILFFLWGVAYGFLDTLNGQFQDVSRMSLGQSIGIHSAYFTGYFFAPITFGRIVLKRWGFKACFIVGLCVYGCGTLVFWPSAVLASFPAFLISNFIVGLGLSTLEIAANPFSALCGPPQYAEMRLNFSQGVQAIGSVVSPLLAAKVLFKSQTAPSLLDAQWTYLGIALFVFLLAVAYYYIPLPDATDQELEDASERADFANVAEVKGIRVIWITFGLGVFSQFCYVGAQESISTSFNTFITTNVNSMINTTNELAIARSTFAATRFLAVGLGFFIKPRYQLLVFYIGGIILSALAITYKGHALVVIIMLLFACEGPIFSIIYAMCLRGLGRHTKNGSALMTASICGGAVFPPIMNAAAHSLPQRAAYSYCVVTAAFAFGTLLPVWVNAWPAARKQVDPIKRDQSLPQSSERPDSRASTGSRGPRALVNFKRRRKVNPEPPATTEHIEQSQS